MYSSRIEFLENSQTYFTIETKSHNKAHYMVIDAIFNLMAILSMGDQCFDDEIIDRLKFRIEELRIK